MRNIERKERLFQIRSEERFNFVERNLLKVIVKVCMHSVWHDEQFLVVSFQLFEHIFAEVAGMGVLAMDEEHSRADLVSIRQNGLVDERERGCHVPSVVGAEGAFVVAARGLVEGVIVLHELRGIGGQRVRHTSCQGVASVAVVLGALGVELLLHRVAGIGVVGGIVVAFGVDAGHVVHRDGHCGLDARVDGGGVHRKASPAAHAEDAHLLRIDIGARGEIVDGGAEVFGINVRRSHITGLPAALTGEGGVEGDGQEATLGQRLRIAAGHLLLHGTERAADGDGGQFACGILGNIQVGGEGDAVAVVEGNLRVVHLVALWEYLVPLLSQNQLFFHCVIGFNGLIVMFLPALPAAGGEEEGEAEGGE